MSTGPDADGSARPGAAPEGAGPRSWTLRRRVAVLVSAVAVVIVALLLSGTYLLVQVRDRQERISVRYFDAIRISDMQFVALLDAETGIRGYALTGDRSTLEPVRALQTGATRADSARLRSLVADDPAVVRGLEQVQASAQRWWTGWALPTQQAVAQGGKGAVTDGDVLRGKQLFDTVRHDYQGYLDTLRKRRLAAVATLRTQTTLLFTAAVAGLLLLAAMAVGLWVLLLRWVVRPVDRLGEETRAVLHGDLDHPVAVHGPPEIEALGADIDSMRRGIVEQLQDVRRARDEVEASRAELEARSADLERSNRDLEQFAYVASHDLQEPLRKVASFCQLLQKRYGGQLDDRADQYIGFAVDGAKRMQQLINDLLAFSRVGRVGAGEADVDLQACLGAALRNLSAALEASGAEVTSDPLPTVRGEAGLLTQLLQNLVGNGVKFRRPDVPPRVHLGVRRVEDEWEFCCVDNGIGVEPQYAERVFVIFQRLHPKDEYEGTGIGLALCRKIVEFHGGRIWIDTEGGAPGTTIRWTLPVRAESTSPQDAAAAPAAAAVEAPAVRAAEEGVRA